MTKPCWLVSLPAGASFAMVGQKMTFAEALRCARVIWPDAEVC